MSSETRCGVAFRAHLHGRMYRDHSAELTCTIQRRVSAKWQQANADMARLVCWRRRGNYAALRGDIAARRNVSGTFFSSKATRIRVIHSLVEMVPYSEDCQKTVTFNDNAIPLLQVPRMLMSLNPSLLSKQTYSGTSVCKVTWLL